MVSLNTELGCGKPGVTASRALRSCSVIKMHCSYLFRTESVFSGVDKTQCTQLRERFAHLVPPLTRVTRNLRQFPREPILLVPKRGPFLSALTSSQKGQVVLLSSVTVPTLGCPPCPLLFLCGEMVHSVPKSCGMSG